MSARSPWLQLALALPVMFYAGAPFYAGAWSALRHRVGQHEYADRAGHRRGIPLFASWQTVRGGHEVYFEAAAVIIALILMGRMLEARARGKASAGHPRV